MLVVNLFFKPDSSKKAKASTEQVAVKNNTLESRVATQAGLPLVDLYKDEQGKTYLTSGLLFNDNILTLSWDEELPGQIYFKKSHTSLPLEKASNLTQSANLSDPVVYQLENTTALFPVADLPNQVTCQVELIYPKAYSNNPLIYTSYFSKGDFSSIGTLDGNAIAVAKTKQGYEPIGIYMGREGKLIPIQNFDNIKPLISSHKAMLDPVLSEQFYTLENEYSQYVFSNIGGALAEINLPVKSEKHPNSSVFPTRLDQQFSKISTAHATFPAQAYYKPSSTSKGQFVKEEQLEEGSYYPLIRRAAVDKPISDPRYYAFNIVSEYPGISELQYQVTHFDADKIVFEAKQNHRKIIKTFSIDNNKPYTLQVSIQVEGDTQGLWVTSGVPEAEFNASTQPPALKLSQLKKNKFEVSKISLPKTSTDNQDVSPKWVSNSNGFFAILVDPLTQLASGYKVNKVPSSSLLSRIDLDLASKAKKTAGYEILLPLSSSAETLLNVYAGPLSQKLLAAADVSNSNYTDAQSFHGFLPFISEPCAKILFVLMNAIHSVVGSWGLSIILLTIVLRIILYPLNTWSIKTMRKNQEIGPEIAEIQAKYKKNPKQAQVEIMAHYRKRKVNPLSGCLPLLIQLPFLMGMFNLLKSAFVLRGAPFIHGWIDNLTAPDVLFSWSKAIPFFGTDFHLLPIISAIMIWFQQKLSFVGPTDKSLMTDQQKQQKMMGNLMLVFITLMCYSLPSGLNLYFISSTVLGILQHWITNKLIDRKKAKPVVFDKKPVLKEKQA